MPEGHQLKVTLCRAELNQDLDWFSKNDPYVVCRYPCATEWQSSVKDEGGRHVQWNESFVIDVQKMEHDLWFDCLEQDLFSSQMHGWGRLSI